MDSNTSAGNPLVTVVTITYNSSSYVRDAIESVLAQSYTNIEYVIGDDCSTDDTWQIIQEYDDYRIIAYRNESNVREYANRNKAINKAKGKYLIFIDGDDVIYPHGLDFMVRMLEAFPASAMAIMRPYHSKIIYPVELNPYTLFLAEYFHKSLLDTAFTNTFFKLSILKGFGGLSEKYAAGDNYIRLKIAKENNCLLINDNLTWWRETPGQAFQRLSNTVYGFLQAFNVKIEMLDENCPFTAEEKVLATKNVQRKVVIDALKMVGKGEVLKGLQILISSNLIRKVVPLLFSKYKKIDPFFNYSAVNPIRLSYDFNPFARKK